MRHSYFVFFTVEYDILKVRDNHPMINFIKTHIVVSTILALVTLGSIGAVVIVRNGSGDEALTATVKRGDIAELIRITGTVKPAADLELAFERSGRVRDVSARVGDRVRGGQTIATLVSADLSADLLQARANLDLEKARLNETVAGTRPEEIAVQEARVAKAQNDLFEAKKSFVDKLQESYTKADDAVRGNVDLFMNNPRTGSPSLNFYASSDLKNRIESSRASVEAMFVLWQGQLSTLTENNNLELASSNAKKNLQEIKTFLDDVAFALNALTPTAILSQSTIDSWRGGISGARTDVNAAVSALSTGEEKIRSTQSLLVVAERELSLSRAGNTAEAIRQQEARVTSAEASVLSIQSQIQKTVIVAPINGVITKQEAKVGQIVTAGTPVVSLISDAHFQIEANVPEVEVAKIAVGASATITLDAYEDEAAFSGKVIKLDPAETIVEGVPAYKVTLEFSDEDQKIKSGMTANVEVIVREKKNVLLLPERAISRGGNSATVTVTKDGKEEVKTVTTGMRSPDGSIEIVLGLSEGEIVVMPKTQ